MIPKILHFVWVGDKEKPDLVKKCIESWQKFCPDYNIIEWNNEKFEQIKNTYSQQAFENKKWAFVSDYIRLYALYNYGGIYIDTDIEITHNIDKFLSHDFVSCFELYQNNYSPICSAFMGAKKNSYLIKELLEYYESSTFETRRGLDLTPNTERITKYFVEKYHIKQPFDGTKKLELSENCIIYPYHYFCVNDYNKENYAIHHFNGSWVDSYRRKNLLRLGRFTIVRLKYIEGKDRSILPLSPKECLISLNLLYKNRYWGVIKKL